MLELIKNFKVVSSLYRREEDKVSNPTLKLKNISSTGLFLKGNPSPKSPAKQVGKEARLTFSTMYDYNTLPLVIQSASCFGQYSPRASQCKTCPLASHCGARGHEIKEENKKLKLEAQDEGIDLKKLKIPKGIFMDTAEKYECKHSITCTASNLLINKGEEMYHIKGWGVLHPKVMPFLLEMESK